MLLADILIVIVLLVALTIAVTMLCHCLLAVPFVPTPWPVVEAMVDAATWRGDEVAYDLGAGDARLLIAALRKHPRICATGFEVVPTVWLLGKLRLWIGGCRASLRCRDFFGQPLNDADVVFLYVLPKTMADLERKFDEELRPGTQVISHCFRFPHRPPLTERTVEGRWGKPATVRTYRW